MYNFDKIKWRTLHADWSEYNSNEHSWKDIPNKNIIRVVIMYNGGEMNFSGWDAYWIEEMNNGIKVGTWKDDDPEDPFYDKGCERIFTESDSKIETSDIEYKDISTWRGKILDDIIKRGIWVDTETAKQMNIL